MCVFGGAGSSPEPVAIQQPASMQDESVQTARNDAQKRLRAAAGARSTVLANDSSASAPLVGKTALGA